MKKAIASLLLVLMLIIMVHPIMNMHFCGEKLSSVRLWDAATPACCCTKTKAKTNISEAQTITNSPFSPAQLSDYNCCHSSEINLAVDNYKTLSLENAGPVQASICLALPWLENLQISSLGKTDFSYSLELSPPPILKSLGRLSLFCLFQI